MRSKKIRILPKRNPFMDFGVKNIKIKEIHVMDRAKKVEFLCLVDEPGCLEQLDIIEEKFYQAFDDVDLEIRSKIAKEEFTHEEKKLILDRVILDLKRKRTVAKTFLFFYEAEIRDKKVYIALKNQVAVDQLMEANIDKLIEHTLSVYGLQKTVKFHTGDFEEEIGKLKMEVEEEHNNRLKAVQVEAVKIAEENGAYKKIEKVKTSASEGVILGREIKDSTSSFEEFDSIYQNETCTLEGQVFDVDIRITATKKQLVIFSITNLKDSITVKFFAKENDEIKLKKDMWVKVKGKKQLDTFSNNEDILFASAINEISVASKKRVDNESEKHIELHTHTKMSEMVGSIETKELVARAIEYGQEAIAITDYGVAHSFPFAYKAAKGSDIKVIFGCDAYMVDDTRPMVENAKDVNIMEETYVVYDLETMGLNSHNGEIIEIGAVKMIGTRIVDTFAEFVNPKKPIPVKIQELTGISNDMVAGSEMIDAILPKFMEFIGDATLVAHNAKFDIGFLKRDCKNVLNMDYKPALIDTLQWARDLLPASRGHGLKSVTKALGVSLDNHHRAVDDSQATAQVFGKFLEMFAEKGAEKLNELDGVFPINIQKQSTYNIMLLVKNRDGLKNLYRLVSEGHLNHYGNKKPRIPKSLIEECREGIILGAPSSMHFNNEGELISEYMRYNLSDIEKKAEFYDYIELQPRDTYSELIEAGGTGTIASYADIEKANRYFYELGTKLGKLVTASSNVHYLDEEDAIIRSVLLYGSGSVFRDNQYKTDNKFYYRTTREMLKEFSYFGEETARELIIKNPKSIADMVEKVKPVPDGFYPPKIDNAENICREMTYEKAYRIYGNPLPEIVEKRIERELEAIIGNGFAVLYLSAQKLVKESLDNGYLVGSRGSVGSSLVAFMMDITEVNALYPHYICENPECKHSEFMEREGAGVDLPDKICPKCGETYKKDGHAIPFEVFMGFNGDKVPDIDLNFSGEYQSEIHRYCEKLFGIENVFKAGTISTLAEKNAFGYVKKYFEEHDMKVRSAEMTRLAKKVEGAKKTTGQHPGGMIVVPQGHSIYEFSPVQRPANDVNNPSITTHFDYHVMDEQLVKLDILGHDDPTTIKLLQEYTGVDIYKVPLADKETLKLFSGTESLGVSSEQIGSRIGSYGVPEFGTQFVRQMLEATNPTTFSELVRISGLSHGTDVWLNNAQEFVRAGKATLSEVISVRDDIMNYLIDSGIEKGTAFKIMEFVRKGMPSRNPEQWEEYSKLMKEHKVADWYIESCRRIKYMFPKGHAVAYVMMAMRIAYFKVHYPLAFYAAYLSRKADDFDSDIMLQEIREIEARRKELSGQGKLDVREKTQLALCEIIVEMYARGIEFEGVDIYKSEGFKFTIDGDKIRVPLIAINGLGASVVENILRERELGKFISYEDLKRRSKASGTVIEKLKAVRAVEGLSETNQRSLF